MKAEAIQDYLKAIYELSQEVEPKIVATSVLARHLGIRQPSVTEMFQKLASTDPPLVDYHPYRGAALTAEGMKIALETVRHHRLIECFLCDVLGYTWDQVHDQADQLEHAISETFEERIVIALGNPEVDPHGSPIPGKDGTIPKVNEIRLTDLEPGITAIISRVSDHDPGLLRQLKILGLMPQTIFKVQAHNDPEGLTAIRVQKTEEVHILAQPLTDHIYAQEMNIPNEREVENE